MLQTFNKPRFALRKAWDNGLEMLRPALVITRREIKDTLRDWRIVLPIVILVTAFPFLANIAANQGLNFVNQYGAELIMERLLPFLMLVVGFFPSTFSLVIALETFVGEKERRSLEPLLAMPLSDLQLYIGKLLAATIPPVLASYVGMSVYLLLLGSTRNWWPTLSLLLVSMTLATVESLVMVSGAVIVSCTATSVRAANLLASFIIIPMAFLLQVEAGVLLYANYNGLWMIALFLIVLNILLIRLGVRVFDREHQLGGYIDQINLRKAFRTFWQAAWPHRGVKHLYTKEVPGLLRAMWPELLITAGVITIGGMLVGGWAAERFSLPAEAFNIDEIRDIESIESMAGETGLLQIFSTWGIFFNNARSLALSALLALFSMGMLAILLLMAPIAIIVYIVMQIGVTGLDPWAFFAVTVLPHGILELPAAIIATAQAMRMGDVVLTPPNEGGGINGVVRELGHFLKLFVAVVLPVLLAAAWIEAKITPQLLMNYLNR